MVIDSFKINSISNQLLDNSLTKYLAAILVYVIMFSLISYISFSTFSINYATLAKKTDGYLNQESDNLILFKFFQVFISDQETYVVAIKGNPTENLEHVCSDR